MVKQIKKMVLTQSNNTEEVNQAILDNEVINLPTPEVIDNMKTVYSNGEKTGNEYTFAIATDGSTSSIKEGHLIKLM